MRTCVVDTRARAHTHIIIWLICVLRSHVSLFFVALSASANQNVLQINWCAIFLRCFFVNVTNTKMVNQISGLNCPANLCIHNTQQFRFENCDQFNIWSLSRNTFFLLRLSVSFCFYFEKTKCVQIHCASSSAWEPYYITIAVNRIRPYRTLKADLAVWSS